MLKRLGAKNFKAFQDVEIELGKISVLIGPNRTGKSSLLQVLALLKQSLQTGALRLNGPLVDLGSLEDIAHGRNPSMGIEFRLGLMYETADVEGLSGKEASAIYAVQFDESGLAGHDFAIESPIRIRFRWNRWVGTSQMEPPSFPLGSRTIAFSPRTDIGSPLTSGGWSGDSPDPALDRGWSEYLAPVPNLLRSTFIVPAVRGIENSSYPLQEGPTTDFLSTSGPAAQASLVLSTLAYRRELEKAISDVSFRILEARIEARLSPGRNVAGETQNGHPTNLVNEGFGLNQLTLMLAQCIVSPAKSVLGIEEPRRYISILALKPVSVKSLSSGH